MVMARKCPVCGDMLGDAEGPCDHRGNRQLDRRTSLRELGLDRTKQDLALHFELNNNVKQTTYIFLSEDVNTCRMLWHYNYYDEGRLVGEPLSNHLCVCADYNHGVLHTAKLTMDIVLPDRRGKRFFVGVDISPDSRIYPELSYVPHHSVEKTELILVELRVGQKRVQLSEDFKLLPPADEQALVPVNDKFIPIRTRIPLEYGGFKIPFLHESLEEKHIFVPLEVKKS